MYKVEIADLYELLEKDSLTWEILSGDLYQTEEEAYQAIGKEVQEDYELHLLGRYVYRIKKEQ